MREGGEGEGGGEVWSSSVVGVIIGTPCSSWTDSLRVCSCMAAEDMCFFAGELSLA